MKCPRCQGPLTVLFLSTVCDRCDPPGGAARTTGGFYAWTYVRKEAMVMFAYACPDEEALIEKFLTSQPDEYKVVRVESSQPFHYNRSGYSELVCIFPDKPSDDVAFDSRYAGYQHAWVVSG